MTGSEINSTETAGSFASYLARRLEAREGFRRAVPAEAELLAEASTHCLTLADGLHLRIVCIVDAEADETKKFPLPLAEVEHLGRELPKYTGRISGAQMVPEIEIWEVRARVTPEDEERLERLRQGRLARRRLAVSAFAFDLSTGTVKTFSPGAFFKRRALQKLLTSPRDEGALKPLPAHEPHPARATQALLALLAAVFAAELLLRVGPLRGVLEPSIETLVAMGGLTRSLVQEGEVWRLFSCALLHAGLLHILFNGVALWMAGTVLEGLVGPFWLVALFSVGALGGSIASLTLNAGEMVGIGASGAIMGLFAAALVVTRRLPVLQGRSLVRSRLLGVLIPSMLPIAIRAGERIDIAAHFGGAVFGFASGALLLLAWPEHEARPGAQSLSRALAALGALAFLWAGAQAARTYPAIAQARELIPETDLPHGELQRDALPALEKLARDHPHDPRGHFFLALVLIDAGQLPQAEAALRAALGEKVTLRLQFKPSLAHTLSTTLAAVVAQEGRQAEAQQLARPLCDSKGTSSWQKSFDHDLATLRALRLCP